MPVTVFVDLRAQAGKGDALGVALRDLYDELANNDGGLESITQYRDAEDPDHYVEVETWGAHGQHLAWSEVAIANGMFAAIVPLLAAAPAIANFDQTGAMRAS